MKLQVPEFLTRLPAVLKRKVAKPRPPRKLRAATAARRLSPAMDDDMDDEPTTRLSSAFFVVLILHLVAVGGIWAFNSIKAHRRGIEPSAKTSAAAAKPAANPVSVSNSTTQTPPAPAPAAPTEARPQPTALAAPLTAPVGAAGKFYVVKPNDNLTKIATTLGVSVADLQAANNAKDIAILRPGQAINVPARKSGTPERSEAAAANTTPKRGEESTRTYAVKKGDTATSIAKRLGVTVDELLALNKVSDPKKLQLGQSLKVPAKKTN